LCLEDTGRYDFGQISHGIGRTGFLLKNFPFDEGRADLAAGCDRQPMRLANTTDDGCITHFVIPRHHFAIYSFLPNKLFQIRPFPQP
jgi:hypothetical protein